MNSDNATPVTKAPPKARGAIVLRTIVGLAAFAGLIWLGHFAIHAYHYAETDDAYTAGHLHQISAQIGGQVVQVLVDDNQAVKKGQVLARIDPVTYRIAVDRAHAAYAEARAQKLQADSAARLAQAQLAETHAKLAQSAAMGKMAAAQFILARTSYKREMQMFNNGGAATQADVDKAKATLDTYHAGTEAAAAYLDAAKAAITSSIANYNSARAQAQVAEAGLAAAQAAVNNAERQYSFTTITAPADGRIGNKHIEVGNTVEAGQTLLSLAEPEVWVVANFKETKIASMHRGQEVDLTIDAIPGVTLHGKVDSISPASGAEFALLPPDNATGNFNKIVQRVPVKIDLDPTEVRRLGHRLRLGLSAIVEVHVH